MCVLLNCLIGVCLVVVVDVIWIFGMFVFFRLRSFVFFERTG